MIKRILSDAPKIIKICHVTLCRLFLDYVCEVWDLNLVGHIDRIKMIQRRAVRFISSLHGREGVNLV